MGALYATNVTTIYRSQVLPELAIDFVEEVLRRSRTEDDGAISRWLFMTFHDSEKA